MRRGRGRRIVAAVLAFGPLGLAGVAGVLLVAPSSAAAARTDVVQGRYLRLESVADWEAASRMRQGESVRWDVEVSANAPEPGQVTIGVSATGGAAVVVDARLCAVAWRGEECPGGTAVLRQGWAVPRDGGTVVLARTDATGVSRLRQDVAMDASAGQGSGSAELRVHADGAGDSVEVGPALPPTGSTVPVLAIVAGALLLVLGVVAILVTGARRGRKRQGDEQPAAESREGEFREGDPNAARDGRTQPDPSAPDEQRGSGGEVAGPGGAA